MDVTRPTTFTVSVACTFAGEDKPSLISFYNSFCKLFCEKILTLHDFAVPDEESENHHRRETEELYTHWALVKAEITSIKR
jgi:hypothetical protein